MTTPGDQFQPEGWSAVAGRVDHGPLGSAVRAALEAFYTAPPGGSWEAGLARAEVPVTAASDAAAVPAPAPSVAVRFMGISTVRVGGDGLDVMADVLADGVPRVCLVSVARVPQGDAWVVQVAPTFFP